MSQKTLKKNGICSLLIGIIAALIMLNGCSKRIAPEGGLSVILPKGQTHEQLSRDEITALNTRGQIDTNLPENAMNDIAEQYTYYLRKGRSSMSAVSKRSEQYLNYARNVFKQKGMPEELANLAIIESGYKADAVSSAGAAGAWQFMPATGAKYGLAQDSWIDERLDPYRATEAAAEYLQALYSYFGDWPTAIAAYNAGEGKMLRAKAKTGSKDFFEVTERNHMLDEKAQLREETKQYVPRFLAVTKIMRNLPKLGFEPINPATAEKIHRFTVAPGTDLNALSRACALSWPEFSLYNKHQKQRITSTSKRTFIYVPSRAQRLAAEYLSSNSQPSFAGWKIVQTQAEDSLEKISKRSRTPLALLKTANPGDSRLMKGQTIIVPPNYTAAINKETGRQTVQKLKTSPDQIAEKVHTIQARETIYSIARKYNVPHNELIAFNGINNPAAVQVGTAIKIPSVSAKKAGEKSGKRKAMW